MVENPEDRFSHDKAHIIRHHVSMRLVWKRNKDADRMANSVDPDQMAPLGTV